MEKGSESSTAALSLKRRLSGACALSSQNGSPEITSSFSNVFLGTCGLDAPGLRPGACQERSQDQAPGPPPTPLLRNKQGGQPSDWEKSHSMYVYEVRVAAPLPASLAATVAATFANRQPVTATREVKDCFAALRGLTTVGRDRAAET